MLESVVVKAEPLRVVFADDDEATRMLLRVLLGLIEGVEIVGEAADGHEAVLLAQETAPHPGTNRPLVAPAHDHVGKRSARSNELLRRWPCWWPAARTGSSGRTRAVGCARRRCGC